MDAILPDVEPQFMADPPSLGEYEGFQVYPMPAFVKFSVPDPLATAHWYVRALGFGVMYAVPTVDGVSPMVHLRRRKYQDILLVAGEPTGGGISLDATGELAAIATRSAMLSDHAGVVDTPYGPRELRLSDPHGHSLVFFEAPENPAPTIDDAVTNATEP